MLLFFIVIFKLKQGASHLFQMLNLTAFKWQYKLQLVSQHFATLIKTFNKK